MWGVEEHGMPRCCSAHLAKQVMANQMLSRESGPYFRIGEDLTRSVFILRILISRFTSQMHPAHCVRRSATHQFIADCCPK